MKEEGAVGDVLTEGLNQDILGVSLMSEFCDHLIELLIDGLSDYWVVEQSLVEDAPKM